MEKEYRVTWERSANFQPSIEKYYEDGKLINPPIPSDDVGNTLLDLTKELMLKAGLESLSITATKK